MLSASHKEACCWRGRWWWCSCHSVSLSSGGGISLPCKPPLSRTSMGSSRISAQGSPSGSCNVGCQLLTGRARESQASGSYGGAIWGRKRQVLQEAELGIGSPTGRRRWPFLLLVPAAFLSRKPRINWVKPGLPLPLHF